MLENTDKNKYLIMQADACNIAKSQERLNNIKAALANNSLIALTIELTSSCNLRCNFCGKHSVSILKIKKDPYNKSTNIHLDTFRDIIDKCKGMNKIKVLYLHGNGEPLLHPKIVEMVAIAKKAEIADEIKLVTNGVLLNTTLFCNLVEAGITSFRVSLDYISPQKYLKFKGVDLCAKVLANIDACIDYIMSQRLNVVFSILCIGSDSDEADIENENKKILEYFKYKINEFENIKIECRKIFNWVDSVNRISEGGRYRRQLPCEAPFYSLMIHSDGDISMCCADSTKQLVIDNIRDVGCFNDILTSKTLKLWRKSLLVQNFNPIPACECCEVYSSTDEILMESREELLGVI